MFKIINKKSMRIPFFNMDTYFAKFYSIISIHYSFLKYSQLARLVSIKSSKNTMYVLIF
jgi:hypothetical protein